ncbi:MAG: ABC transporter ATP-binding protein [Rhodothermales bacterium]
MAKPSINVTNLTKVYTSAFSRNPVKALDNLNLTVEAGEIFGLLGPNGAGKTTLVKVLLSVVHPTAGEASLFGIPAKLPEARKSIGFLPENHRFPEFLTPDQMLTLYGRLSGVSAKKSKSLIPGLLEMVNMSEWRHVKIKKFSKGMMQRVGIAQALMNDPELIFLDEPTDGVDPIGRREIRDVLLVLKDQGKTIFLNSHLLSEVEQTCTTVAILNKGKKIREGTVEDLTRVETHFDLKTTQIPQPLLESLADRFSLVVLNAGAGDDDLTTYRLQGADRAGLNGVIDVLRQKGIEIEEVQPLRQSLEDRFVEEVKEHV